MRDKDYRELLIDKLQHYAAEREYLIQQLHALDYNADTMSDLLTEYDKENPDG